MGNESKLGFICAIECILRLSSLISTVSFLIIINYLENKLTIKIKKN